MLPSLLHNIVILGGVAPRMVDSGPARSCSESHKILSWACATFRMKQDYGDIISKLEQPVLGRLVTTHGNRAATIFRASFRSFMAESSRSVIRPRRRASTAMGRRSAAASGFALARSHSARSGRHCLHGRDKGACCPRNRPQSPAWW